MQTDIFRLVETTRIELGGKKSWQLTCIKPVDNLQQTCYHQAEASHANASWLYRDENECTLSKTARIIPGKLDQIDKYLKVLRRFGLKTRDGVCDTTRNDGLR